MSFQALMPFLPALLTGLRGGMEWSANNQMAAASRVMAERTAVANQFQAEQARVNAGQAVAASQRDAAEQARQGRLLQSRALALAAAGGGGASDPTIVNIMGSIAGEGAYRSMVSLYKGEEQARALRMEAAARDYDAAAAREGGALREQAYKSAARTGILRAGLSLFEKYGMADQPKAAAGAGWTSGYDLPAGDTGGNFDGSSWQSAGA